MISKIIGWTLLSIVMLVVFVLWPAIILFYMALGGGYLLLKDK